MTKQILASFSLSDLDVEHGGAYQFIMGNQKGMFRFLAELDRQGIDVSGVQKILQEMYWYLKLLWSHVNEVQLLLEVARSYSAGDCKING